MSDRQFCLAAPPETLDEDPPVRDFMTRRLVGISVDAGVDVAFRLLSSASVRHLPAMEADRCVGLIFEHDVVCHLAANPVHQPGRKVLVAHLHRPVPTVRPLERRSTVARQMAATKFDAVLVTDGDKLLGIVTASDVVRSIAGQATNFLSATPTNRPNTDE